MVKVLSKIPFTWRLILLTALPFSAFVFVALWGVVSSGLKDKYIADVMAANVNLLKAANDMLRELQKERHISTAYIGGRIDRGALEQQRHSTDTTHRVFTVMLEASFVSPQVKQSVSEKVLSIKELRAEVDNKRLSAGGSFQKFTGLIDAIIGIGEAIANAPTSKGVGKVLTTICLLQSAKESCSRLDAAVTEVLTRKGEIPNDDLHAIVKFKGAMDENLNSPALVLSKESRERLNDFKKSKEWMDVDRLFFQLVQKASGSHLLSDYKDFNRSISAQFDNIGSVLESELSGVSKRVGQISYEIRSELFISTFILAVVTLGLIFLGYAVVKSISLPLRRLSDVLNRAGEEIALAADEVASASHSLAEKSSSQAEAIEKISSVLEEMSATTQSNADNALEADGFMAEVRHMMQDAKDSMERLSSSMDEISKASAETQKIVKTIDEIAFQTNLLALNAAVEAARAGDAGAGFAVVAEEVRNLAMRSANAARNTNDLIQGTVDKVSDGNEIMSLAAQAFQKVADKANLAAELMSQIAMASKEQSVGIGQLSRAIGGMEEVTQDNAANSEKLAAASEELSGQAMELMSAVKELIDLVGARERRRKRWKPSVSSSSRKTQDPLGGDSRLNDTGEEARRGAASQMSHGSLDAEKSSPSLRRGEVGLSMGDGGSAQ